MLKDIWIKQVKTKQYQQKKSIQLKNEISFFESDIKLTSNGIQL